MTGLLNLLLQQDAPLNARAPVDSVIRHVHAEEMEGQALQ